MVLLLLFVSLVAGFGNHEDLSGQQFVFPETSATAYVTVTPLLSTLDDATVCLRFVTDLTRTHAIFSLATSATSNAFLIFKSGGKNVIFFDVDNGREKFRVDYELNVWHSVCATWEQTSGLVQLWFDGKPSITKHTGGSTLSSFTIVLGQEQDSPGGGFDDSQSFVGILSDLHMWNYVLSACEIEYYVDDLNFTPGNVLNWKALEYVITGQVLLQDKQLSCQ